MPGTTVNGTRFDDIVVPDEGAGFIRGGVFVAAAANQSTDDDDIISTSNGDDLIEAAGGADLVSAGNGDDSVSGGAGADVISGANGADVLDGGADDDQLDGGNGRDLLSGGGGADVLTGGNGPDTFAISAETDSSATLDGGFDAAAGDVITDFENNDVIDVGDLVLSGAGAPTGLAFSGSTAAAWSLWTGSADGDTFVFADVDGDAVADVAVRLEGEVELDADAFTGLGEQAGDSDVTAVDDTGAAIEAGVEAGVDATGNVLDNDLEVEGDVLTVVSVRRGDETGQSQSQLPGSVVQGAYGALVLNADGSYSYEVNDAALAVNSLAEGESLTDTFTYMVEDEDGDLDEATLAITVHGANDAPDIRMGGPNPTITVQEGDVGAAIVNAVDPDNGAELSFAISGGADADLFSIDPETGALTFNEAPEFDAPLDADADNVYEVEVEVSDGLGGFDTQALSIAVTDEALAVADANDFDDADPSIAPDHEGLVGTDAGEVLNGGNRDDAIFAGDGDDRLGGRNGDDMLFGQANEDMLFGANGDDELFGGSGDDLLEGMNGDDQLFGGSGDDRLEGGRGEDVVVGGLGADILAGGLGGDTFVFEVEADSAVGAGDVITDFRSGEDIIDLSAFGLTEAQVTWEDSGGDFEVSVDLDLDGLADLSFLVQTSGELQASDFFL